MDNFAPVVNLLVGPGISGRSRQGSTAVEVGRLGYDTGDEVDEGLGAGGRVVMNDQVRAFGRVGSSGEGVGGLNSY